MRQQESTKDDHDLCRMPMNWFGLTRSRDRDLRGRLYLTTVLPFLSWNTEKYVLGTGICRSLHLSHSESSEVEPDVFALKHLFV